MTGPSFPRRRTAVTLNRRGELWRRTAAAVALGALVGGALLWATRPAPDAPRPGQGVTTTMLVDPSTPTTVTVPIPDDPADSTNKMATCIQRELDKTLDVTVLQEQGPDGADVAAALSRARQTCADEPPG